MALLHQNTVPSLAGAQHVAVPTRLAAMERPMAEAVRALLLDPAMAGQPGRAAPPLILANAATVLWTRFLKFDAADPYWPDRDRFVISADASPLLCALLYLTGHEGFGIETLRGWRQSSVASSASEVTAHPSVEPSAGPPGQALASGIGLALAERLLAARFGKSLVDHRTWVFASEADLISGVGHESASFAGQLRLNRLAVLWDTSEPAEAAGRPVPNSDDVQKRFASYGWAVRRVDGRDLAEVASALSFAMRSRKPTLVACAGDAASEPRPPSWRGRARARASNPEIVLAGWKWAGARGSAARRGWLKRARRHTMRAEFERVMSDRLPDSVRDAFAAEKAAIAQREPVTDPMQAGQEILAHLMPIVPELIAGSAQAALTDPAVPGGVATIGPDNYRGRYIRPSTSDHGLAAVMNGMALHGGVIPCAETALALSDAIRPALRLAAATGKRVIHVLEHDVSGSAGEGATHQPAGHLASLRAVPNLYVYRPADAIETAECWELALRRAEGPSLLVLTREPVPPLRTDAGRNLCARGGYVLAEADGPRQATLIASGGEVAVAVGARRILARRGIAVAVVSLPCWELFALQDEAYRASVLGAAPRMGIEAALGFGWERWLGEDGWFAGAHDDSAGEPSLDLTARGGLRAEAIAAALGKRLGRDRIEETNADVQQDRH